MPNVQSVVRAFHLLEALTAGDLGITELAERTELPKSTVARLVRTLERIGAVERADEDGRYRIGAQIVNLAGVASPTANLISIVRPHLRLLADLTGEDAGLSVPDGNRVHYIDQVSSDNDIQVRDWTGERVAMHAVPSGQVILAHWPEDRLERYLERPLNAYTPATITDPEELRKRLRQVHEDGYVWAHEEFEPQLIRRRCNSRGSSSGRPRPRTIIPLPAPGTAENRHALLETAERLTR